MNKTYRDVAIGGHEFHPPGAGRNSVILWRQILGRELYFALLAHG